MNDDGAAAHIRMHGPSIKLIQFGVEIEMDALSVEDATSVVHRYFEGESDHLGRTWALVPDGSVPHGFELVTPPLRYADIGTLQEVFRNLRQAGARRTVLCGLHVHVDARQASLDQVLQLVRVYDRWSEVVARGFSVLPLRRLLFAQPIAKLAGALAVSPPMTFEGLRNIWYEIADAEPDPTRANSSRFTELNLNSLFYRGTVELRIFNATNHAGHIRFAILIALALFRSALEDSGVDESVRGNMAVDADVDEFFRVLKLEGAEFRNLRRFVRSNVSASRRQSKGTNVEHEFHTAATVYTGSEWRDLLDNMWDSGFFLSDEADEFLSQVRKRGEAMEPKRRYVNALLNSDNVDLYAERLLRSMSEAGLGRIITIPGPSK